MKKLLLSAIFLFLVVWSFAQVHVSGYYRKNGTYVQPYTRSSPDSSPYNNYSYPGNTNPYTGKVATGNPETYLKNYSSTNANSNTYSSTSSNNSDRPDVGQIIDIKDKNGQPTGGYLKCYVSDKTCDAYYIYSASSTSYTGYIIYYKDGTVKLYDSNNNLVKTDKTAVTQTIPPVLNQAQQSKIYLKDNAGNYTDSYLIIYYQDEVVKKYRVYDHSDIQVGTMSEFVNGNRFVYNLKGRLLSKK